MGRPATRDRSKPQIIATLVGEKGGKEVKPTVVVAYFPNYQNFAITAGRTGFVEEDGKPTRKFRGFFFKMTEVQAFEFSKLLKEACKTMQNYRKKVPAPLNIKEQLQGIEGYE